MASACVSVRVAVWISIARDLASDAMVAIAQERVLSVLRVRQNAAEAHLVPPCAVSHGHVLATLTVAVAVAVAVGVRGQDLGVQQLGHQDAS